MKNASPGRIVLLAALTVFSGILLLEALPLFIPALDKVAYQFIAVPILVFILTYRVLYLAVEKFIYRKIKLIYKNILANKSTKALTEERLQMDADVIGQVQDEVNSWAEEKRSEIAILHEQANFRKEFLGNVSHELKTPIMSIQGYLENLQDGGIEDPGVNYLYVEKALKNVERMAAMIDDLVDISKLESGELNIKKSKFDICSLTKDVFEALEIQSEQSRISLSIKEGCDHIYLVNADQKLIYEVLINLISNAIKYGKKEGFVHVGFYRMGDRILTEISDNGVGIAQEHLTRVFERFYRIEKSRSRDNGGTGLGLSIVKHIIEAHDQIVNVRSTEGEGSTFSFTLDVA
ncbi:MAG TPA: ATP-binding protein [Chitinophagales bacterium]|nr:sensor histidine kinase [Chitinophagales bacterium]HMX04555.1 ATP-binding protein [Chitinophagales bacterium]HMZ89081.1 ATP-binding protein [Chitinophagales bacterium]HNA57705.1 ATP-binding protein [Chitinophagales bacterium]HNE46239.1 ATP-binding protein [Chitinophagales bacterium]